MGVIDVLVGADEIIVDGFSMEPGVVLTFNEETEETLFIILLAAGGPTLGSSRLRFLDHVITSCEGVLDAEDIALVEEM